MRRVPHWALVLVSALVMLATAGLLVSEHATEALGSGTGFVPFA